MPVKSHHFDAADKPDEGHSSTDTVIDANVAAGQTEAQSTLLEKKSHNDELSKLALVARETSDCVIITDRNFIIEWANDATERVTGYSPDELRGQDLLLVTKAFTMAPQTATNMISQLRAGKRFAAAEWTVRKNGEPMLADFEAIPYRDASGAVTAHVGITRDITARATAEQALRESEEHLRVAQELSGIGSWRYFIDSGELRWSKQLFRAFGRPLHKPPPTFEEYLAYLRPEDRPPLLRRLQRAIHEGLAYEITFQVTRDDGTIAHMYGRANVRREATGRVVELFGTAQDITERVNAEKERAALHERLAAAQRLESLGLLAGGVAHDFNNLLMGVMMDTSVLEREVQLRSPISGALENIREAATRMVELTNRLLAYAGRGRFVLERIDPNEAVASLLELSKCHLNPKISLELDIWHTATTVEIDSSQLHQIVTNLVSNASDALEGQPGRIVVRTRIDTTNSQEKMWVLEVTDSGVGMTEDVRRRIFEPFFTTKQTGHGLGLSTVHGIVQRSKGSIEVRSAPGGGTSVFVHLPLFHEVSTVSPPPPPIVRAESTALRLLIADDEAMVRRSLRRMLELNRASVDEVADGAAAIEALTQSAQRFDVALIDVLMPKMNGYEVLSEVRARHIATKIILMSGYNHLDDAPDVLLTGDNPDAMLQKPFTWEELKRVLQRVLQKTPPLHAER